MIRILVVDDHPIFRRGLAMTLSEMDDISICGEGASADDAVNLSMQLDPDVVLLDLSMPGGGIAALRRILEQQPGKRVAVLTASEDSDDVMQALGAGATGYVLKGIGSRALVDAIRGIARGEGYVAPALGARILSELRMDEPQRHDGGPEDAELLLSQLTPREEQVLQLVAAGYSNKEIAREGDMQEKTVKHHMTRILQKLHVRNRTEAAMLLQGKKHRR